jgi:phosphatidylserine/phosphatidylglycerophosphate/cardiolipin synthase-like enzyme
MAPAVPAGAAQKAAKLTGDVGAPPARAPVSASVAFASIAAPGGPTKARLLSDGLDSWNARLELIESAKTSIDTSYFILEKDPYGYAFLGGLLKKQLEGVKVRVSTDAMADTFGTKGFKAPLRGKDFLQELVNHGGEAYIYHPITERLLDGLKGEYAPLASNHDKILVADGRAGITGGRNVAQDYFASPKDLKGAWRDMDVLLEGKGAADGLVAAFDAELTNGDVSRAVRPDLLGNWDKKDLQLLAAWELMDAWTKAPVFTEAEKTALRADEGARKELATQMANEALARAQSSLPAHLRRAPSDSDRTFVLEQAQTLVTHLETRGSRGRYDAGAASTRQTEAKIIDQTSAASGQRQNGMAPALTAMVEGAKKRIVVENPYVVLTRDMMSALERASARGVEIDIITNSPLSTDSDVTQAFFLEDWKTILARCPTARIFVATGDRKFHTKSAVIDDDEAVISTYNLDLLSGYVNSEVGAVVKSRELAQDLLLAFEQDTKDPANGFLEYRIQRDAEGKPVLKDGEPVSAFGPEDHLPADVQEAYKGKRNLWGNWLRNHVPVFQPLRHR